MPAPVRVQEAYRESREAIEAVERLAGGAVFVWCEHENYLFTGRKKTPISLSEKLESGRFGSWSEIDDLFACTVVVPTIAHEGHVLEYLDSAFVKIELRSRGTTQKPPDTFRFDATRFIGRLRDETQATLVPGASHLPFEVQILTAFEYAWVVATHDLVYKADTVDWRRARLAAQLKAAVEQAEMIIAGYGPAAQNIPGSPHPETEAKLRLVEVFQSMIFDDVISADLAPASWSRFGDNVYSLIRSFSNRYEAPARVTELAEIAARELRVSRSASDLHSGSLFQVVVGLVDKGAIATGKLDKFTVVDSPELRDLYGVSSVPKPFDFES